MRIALALSAAVFAIGTVASPAAAQLFPTPDQSQTPARNLQLSFNPDGTVTLSASSVSIREILAEWARQCGCYVVNSDKLTGGPLPVPVLYERQPQKVVLESLLRQAAGFVLTPKRAGSTSVSNYETIYILATSSPTGTYVPPPVAAPPPMPMPTPGSPDDEIPAVGPIPGAMPTPGSFPPPPSTPGMPTATPPPPGMAPTPAAGRPGMPSVFVPIVPVTNEPSPTAPTAPPSAPTTPSGVPIPIVPAPQNR